MQMVFSVVFVYVFVWACFRILGKRELTQMSPFELVTLLFVPQLFSRALTRQDYSMTNAVIGATTLFLMVFLTSATAYRSRRFARMIQAQPTVLVRRGQIVSAHLDRERISVDDIFSAMHKVGLQRIDQVEWGILESDGKIALVPSRDMLERSPGDGDDVAAAAHAASLLSKA
jgi:uncharacterized membrane protein YcaP (DUF421 family)